MKDPSLVFWDTFIRSVEAEPKDAKPIRGASGLYHPVVAMGVDDIRRRIVIISGDLDGRTAALAQADIQAAIPDSKVILARPIALNLGMVASRIEQMFGRTAFSLSELKVPKGKNKKKLDTVIQDTLAAIVTPSISSLGYAKLDVVSAIQEIIFQLSHLQFENLEATHEAKTEQSPTIRFGKLIGLDPAEVDRKLGNCSIPLYSLTDVQAEVFHKGVDLELAREVLKGIDVLQYFFPPPDQLALALMADNAENSSSIIASLQVPEQIGHPLARPELVGADTKITNIIDALREKGLCVEGELGFELSEEGKTTRANVRFSPREGFISKLSRIISIKVDVSLKDFFK